MESNKTQEDRLLEAIKEAGLKGYNSFDADYRLHIKQAPARLFGLKRRGYIFITKINPDKSVNWILAHQPSKERKKTEEPYKPLGRWEFDNETGMARYVI